MSPRTTGILLVVALLLGGFVYFHEIEGELEREAAAEEEKLIHTGLAPEEIDAIALTTLDGIPSRFERRDGAWWLIAPREDRADATALDAMASALAALPREGTVGSKVDLAAFGLGDAPSTIEFTAQGRTRGLRIGGTTPVGGHRYVARLADDEVAFVASYRVNAFNRNLDDLRDRRVFAFESGSVDGLTVEWPAGEGADADEGGARFFSVSMSRDESGTWRLDAPVEGAADAGTVRDLLSDLIYLRANGFVDERSQAVEEALAETAIRFEIRRQGPEGQGTTVERARIAGRLDDDRLLEAPDDRLYTIAAERLDDLPRRLVDYRFKQLAEFELAAARRLELEFATPDAREDDAAGQSFEPLRIVALLEEAGWTTPGRPLDRDRLSELVRDLSNLSADDLFADEMGEAELAALGLFPPRATLRVEGGANPEAPVETLATLRLGRLDSDRGLFVMRGDSDTVFLLAPDRAEVLPLDGGQYVERFEVASTPDGDDGADGADGALGIGTSGTEEVDPMEGVPLP